MSKSRWQTKCVVFAISQFHDSSVLRSVDFSSDETKTNICVLCLLPAVLLPLNSCKYRLKRLRVGQTAGGLASPASGLHQTSSGGFFFLSFLLSIRHKWINPW